MLASCSHFAISAVSRWIPDLTISRMGSVEISYRASYSAILRHTARMYSRASTVATGFRFVEFMSSTIEQMFRTNAPKL